jgi:dTDP-4-amino-4,6-dideoxygalactose transaminase
VFSDIDLETFNLDQRQGLEVINNSIKALLPVHLFGLPCEMAKIVSLSKKYSCRVIEDAACGLGAELNGNQSLQVKVECLQLMKKIWPRN